MSDATSDLIRELKAAESLLTLLCVVANTPGIGVYLPYGAYERVGEWLATNKAQEAIAKAEATIPAQS